jgi:hypothetical protein
VDVKKAGLIIGWSSLVVVLVLAGWFGIGRGYVYLVGDRVDAHVETCTEKTSYGRRAPVTTTTCRGTWTLTDGRSGGGEIAGADVSDEGVDLPVRALAGRALVDEPASLLPLAVFVVLLALATAVVVQAIRAGRRRAAGPAR